MASSQHSSRRAAHEPFSPWTLETRIKMILWEGCWVLFCQWTPKPFNRWRLWWLRLFGARIDGKPFVHQRVRIQIPWNLTLHDRCCLGDRANAYSLGEIEIGEEAVIAQEVYLCSGTHDFDAAGLPLIIKKIRIEPRAFIGARAFVLPGIVVGADSIVGACSVVTSDTAPGTINAGNPCRLIRIRREVALESTQLKEKLDQTREPAALQTQRLP